MLRHTLLLRAAINLTQAWGGTAHHLNAITMALSAVTLLEAVVKTLPA